MTEIERIERIFAFLIVDEDEGIEGIPAFLDPRTGMMMPMVGADMARMESLKQAAVDIADGADSQVVLAVFEQRTEIERYLPERNSDNGR